MRPLSLSEASIQPRMSLPKFLRNEGSRIARGFMSVMPCHAMPCHVMSKNSTRGSVCEDHRVALCLAWKSDLSCCHESIESSSIRNDIDLLVLIYDELFPVPKLHNIGVAQLLKLALVPKIFKVNSTIRGISDGSWHHIGMQAHLTLELAANRFC